MVRNCSGQMTSKTCPCASSSARTRLRVRTTPFTCGNQASLASRIFTGSGSRARRLQHRQAPDLGTGQDLQAAVHVLDQRRAAFHPIAVVDVEHAVDHAHLGGVDMAADDSVDALAPGLGHHRLLELADELHRSEEHTSELQSLMRISYAVFCLNKKTQINNHHKNL